MLLHVACNRYSYYTWKLWWFNQITTIITQEKIAVNSAPADHLLCSMLCDPKQLLNFYDFQCAWVTLTIYCKRVLQHCNYVFFGFISDEVSTCPASYLSFGKDNTRFGPLPGGTSHASVQYATKQSITQFCPSFCYLTSPRLEYSPQHFVLRDPQTHYGLGPSLTPIIWNR